MLEAVIEELTKLFLKEQFNKTDEEVYYKVNKKDLIKFCITLVKLIRQIDEDENLLDWNEE